MNMSGIVFLNFRYRVLYKADQESSEVIYSKNS